MTRPLLWAWLGLALASLCWAGNALVARAFAGDIPPFSLGFWRWALALGLLLPLAGASLWRHRQLLRRAGWRLWLAALLAITTFNSLLYSAAHSTAAINITLLSTCLPLATFLMAGLLLGEWPPRRAWLGLLLAFAGLLWLLSRGQLSLLWQLSFSRGDLLMLLATLDWALYSVLLRRWQGYFQVPPLTLLTALVLLGLPLQAPLYLYELSQGLRFAPSSGNLLAIAYTAACASVLAYFLWNQGVRVLGAARAAMSNYLMPVFAALLGSLWLDEQLQHYHWSGAALIFIGLLLAGRGTGFNAPLVPPAATAAAPGRSSV